MACRLLFLGCRLLGLHLAGLLLAGLPAYGLSLAFSGLPLPVANLFMASCSLACQPMACRLLFWAAACWSATRGLPLAGLLLAGLLTHGFPRAFMLSACWPTPPREFCYSIGLHALPLKGTSSKKGANANGVSVAFPSPGLYGLLVRALHLPTCIFLFFSIYLFPQKRGKQ